VVSILAYHFRFVTTLPTWWDNCELKCFPWKSPDGKNGYEVRDEIAGFLIRGTDSVVIGEENLSTASVAYVN